MATKKRSNGETDAAKSTERKASAGAGRRKAAENEGGAPPKVTRGAVKAAVKAASKKSARPTIKASHASLPEGEAGARRIPRPKAATTARPKAGVAARKTPLAGPKRAVARKTPPPEADSASKDLSVAIAAVGLDKKALGVEILDVRGRVDYADFLVIMTGRSDRHVSAIAQGIEEELGKKKMAPISVEGMTQSTWVLLDYGDVVVHVFQEDARQLYDIEGLWMDASRVSVPGQAQGEPRPTSQGFSDGDEPS